jgi:hypothetical protein
MKPGSPTERRFLILAHFMTLGGLILGLQFVIDTTGGTLFLFTSLAPLLVLGAAGVLAWVAIARFMKRHTLFDLQSFAPGQVIIQQGDWGDCAYFIESGEVEVIRDEGGASQVVARLSPGQYFGEMALLADAARNATVRAVTPARVAALGRHNFLMMLQVIPSVHEDILKTVQQRFGRPTGGGSA